MSASSYNPAASSSGKLGDFSRAASPLKSTSKRCLALAANVARRLGMVATWQNVQVIRLAIESEAEFSEIAPNRAAELIVDCAKGWSRFDGYDCPSQWEQREVARLNAVDRFWFEDARWRDKFPYAEFRAALRKERGVVAC